MDGAGEGGRRGFSCRSVRYFFYGTLMDAEVRVAVMGTAAASLHVEPARLSGYQRFHMRGATYPVLIPSSESAEIDVVDGVLALGITANQERCLVRFEGDAYRRAEVTVEGRRSGQVTARCFLPLTDDLADEPRPWDLASWRRRDRALYLARIRRIPIAAR